MTQRIRNIETTLGAAFGANQVRAIEFAEGINTSVRNSVIASATSSTAFVDAPDMFVELATGNYRVDLFMPVTVGAAAGNIKFQLVASSGLVATAQSVAEFFLAATAPTIATAATIAATMTGGTTSAWTYCRITATVNVTNAGVLQLQFSQQASNVAASSILAGAIMTATQITP